MREQPDHWHLLKHICMHDCNPEALADVKKVLETLTWDDLSVQARRHRMLPQVADFLIQANYLDLAPHQFRRELIESLYWNRHLSALATDEAARLVQAITECGMTVACTKGVIFQHSLYGGRGVRTFNDIDLMIDPAHKDIVKDVMISAGYHAGKDYDFRTDTLTELPRRRLAMYLLRPDHLPHFFRPITGEGIPYHITDVAFSLTWYSSGWQVPMVEALTDLDEVEVGDGKIKLPSLTPPYSFIFTAMHLFREGWFERAVRAKDLRLGQFADIWRLWHRMDAGDITMLSDLIRRYDIAPPLAWVCSFTDQIFKSRIIEGLGLEPYCERSWLCSTGALDGSYLEWSGDMVERLNNPGSPEFVPALRPPYGDLAQIDNRTESRK
ncbi:nucleotidyltransferase family protein [Streptomyces sp. LZ34]